MISRERSRLRYVHAYRGGAAAAAAAVAHIIYAKGSIVVCTGSLFVIHRRPERFTAPLSFNLSSRRDSSALSLSLSLCAAVLLAACLPRRRRLSSLLLSGRDIYTRGGLLFHERLPCRVFMDRWLCARYIYIVFVFQGRESSVRIE